MKALRPQPTCASTLPSEDDVPACTVAAGRSPVGPVEALVLARVDGARTVAHIAELLSFSSIEVAAIVARLVDLGMVEVPEERIGPAVTGRFVRRDLPSSRERTARREAVGEDEAPATRRASGT